MDSRDRTSNKEEKVAGKRIRSGRRRGGRGKQFISDERMYLYVGVRQDGSGCLPALGWASQKQNEGEI